MWQRVDQPRWDQIPLYPPSVCGVLIAAEALPFEGCCRETHVSSLTGSSKVPLRNHPEDFLQCWAAHCPPSAKGKHQAHNFRWSWGRAVFVLYVFPWLREGSKWRGHLVFASLFVPFECDLKNWKVLPFGCKASTESYRNFKADGV